MTSSFSAKDEVGLLWEDLGRLLVEVGGCVS